jgi:hypothetical protein
MKGISTISYKGKQIFLLDLSYLTLKDREEFKKHIAHAGEVIQKQPPKSVLIITDTTNTKFDTDFVETLKEYTKHNNPYIKASALVGLTGMQKIIYFAVKTFTGRDFYIAKDFSDAQEWLIQQ